MHDNLDQVVDLLRSGQIGCVMFDLDGTLYESSAGIEAQLRDAMVRQTSIWLGIPDDEARVLLRKYRGLYRSSVLGLQAHHGVDPVAFYEAVYDSLDTTAMVQRPGCSEEVARLGEYIPIGVFTNSNLSFTTATLSRLDLDGAFDVVITVEAHGFIRKPEDEAYQMLYGDLGLPPEAVLMFDDIASSLEVMNRLGSHGVLVGNGLREHPYFVDLHTGVEHHGAPSYVTAASHDIVGFLAELNNALH